MCDKVGVTASLNYAREKNKSCRVAHLVCQEENGVDMQKELEMRDPVALKGQRDFSVPL